MKSFTWYLKQSIWIVVLWTRLRLQDMAKWINQILSRVIKKGGTKDDSKSD